MIGLYIYAAVGTIGPAEAKQHSATVNVDIGNVDSAFTEALETEQADTFVYQASHHQAFPDSKLKADYAATDETAAAFEAGLANAKGALSPAATRATPGLEQGIARRIGVRATVQAGNLDGLATFKDYLNIEHSFVAFSLSLDNPDETLALFEQSDALIDAGFGTQDLSNVATLLGGVLAGGGYMTPAEYQVFQTLYFDQLEEFATINNSVYWEVSRRPLRHERRRPATGAPDPAVQGRDDP